MPFHGICTYLMCTDGIYKYCNDSMILAERVRELKETPKGVEDMCREMDEIYNEGIEIGQKRGEQKAKKEAAMTLASMGMSVDKISQAVKENMDQIQHWLAEGAAMSK